MTNKLAGFGSSSNTGTGYTVGGGIEYKFSPAWSVKAEYQYLAFEHENAVLTSGNANQKSLVTDDQKLNTVRVGLNYHFGNVYEPLK